MMRNHRSRLQLAREQRGWSQEQLAEELGITADHIKQWERGRSIPTSFQVALCALLGVNDWELNFSGEESETRSRNGITFLLLPQTMHSLPAPRSHKAEKVHDPALPNPSAELKRLIGRDSLLQQCKQQLIAHHNLALYGLPGIGKTALAVALAYDQEIRSHFYDGVLWAGLGPHPHIPGVLSRWRKLLGLMVTEGDGLPQLLRSASSHRHLLFLLDDVWQIEAIENLHLGGPGCAYLVTTRFAHIASHLAGERAIQVPELDDVDGVKLLAHFAPEVVRQEPDIALTLVHAVGGLPLALTLMSKYLGSCTYTQQPRRLRTALNHLHDAEQRLHLSIPYLPLERSAIHSVDTEISIQSVLAVSDVYLPTHARQALRALALLPTKPTSFTQEAALAVTGAQCDILETLCDAGLLEQQDATCYMLHAVIADYARAHKCEPEAINRLIRYGIDFIETHHSDAFALERESATLLIALDHAWEQERYEELIRGGLNYASFLLHYGWYTTAEKMLLRALTATIQINSLQSKAHLLSLLSTLTHQQGHYEQAQKYAEEGLGLAHQLNNQELICAMLTRQGVVAQELGDYIQAEAYYQKGLELARLHDNQEQICTLLKNLGIIAKKRGNYTLAEAYYREGLELAQQIEHRDLTSLLLMDLGVIANERGEYAKAEKYYQEGFALALQLKHRERICVLLSNLGVVADARGNYALAEVFLNEGLEIARQIGHRERISLLLLNLGVVANRQGNDTSAKAYYQEGLEIARQIGHRERISLLLLNLGDAATQQGNDTKAEAYYQEGLTLARQIGHLEYVSDLLLYLGTLATKQHKLARAKAYLQEGLDLAYQLEHPQLICRLLAAWGDVYLQQQHIRSAERVFREMLALIPEGNQTLKADAQYGLACVAAARGLFDEAYNFAEHSYKIFETLGHRKKSTVRAFIAQLAQPC